jgi:hypothetical protein
MKQERINGIKGLLGRANEVLKSGDTDEYRSMIINLSADIEELLEEVPVEAEEDVRGPLEVGETVKALIDYQPVYGTPVAVGDTGELMNISDDEFPYWVKFADQRGTYGFHRHELGKIRKP